MPLFLWGMVLGIAWCCLAFGRLLLRGGLLKLDRRGVAAWAFCPATGLMLGTVIWCSHWPLALRVRVSEQALLRLVEEVEAGRTRFDPPARAGLFVIDGAYIEGGYVFLETNEGWPLASEGIAYLREGAQPWSRPNLTGRWWDFHFPD